MDMKEIQTSSDPVLLNLVSGNQVHILSIFIEMNLHKTALSYGESALEDIQSRLKKFYDQRIEILNNNHKHTEEEFQKNYSENFYNIHTCAKYLATLAINLSISYEHEQQIEKHLECLKLARYFCGKYLYSEKNQEPDFLQLYQFIENSITFSQDFYKRFLKEQAEIHQIFQSYMKQIGYVHEVKKEEVDPNDMNYYYNKRAFEKFGYKEINKSLLIVENPRKQQVPSQIIHKSKSKQYMQQSQFYQPLQSQIFSSVNCQTNVNPNQKSSFDESISIPIQENSSQKLYQIQTTKKNDLSVNQQEENVKNKKMRSSNNSKNVVFRSRKQSGQENINNHTSQGFNTYTISTKGDENLDTQIAFESGNKANASQILNTQENNKTFSHNNQQSPLLVRQGSQQNVSNKKIQFQSQTQSSGFKPHTSTNIQSNNYLVKNNLKMEKNSVNTSNYNQSTRIGSTFNASRMQGLNRSQSQQYNNSYFKNSMDVNNQTSSIFNRSVIQERIKKEQNRIYHEMRKPILEKEKKEKERRQLEDRQKKNMNFLQNNEEKKEILYYQTKDSHYSPQKSYGLQEEDRKISQSTKLLQQKIRNKQKEFNLENNISKIIVQKFKPYSDFRSYGEVVDYQDKTQKQSYIDSKIYNQKFFDFKRKQGLDVTREVTKSESIFNLNNQVKIESDLKVDQYTVQQKNREIEESKQQKTTLASLKGEGISEQGSARKFDFQGQPIKPQVEQPALQSFKDKQKNQIKTPKNKEKSKIEKEEENQQQQQQQQNKNSEAIREIINDNHRILEEFLRETEMENQEIDKKLAHKKLFYAKYPGQQQDNLQDSFENKQKYNKDYANNLDNDIVVLDNQQQETYRHQSSQPKSSQFYYNSDGRKNSIDVQTRTTTLESEARGKDDQTNFNTEPSLQNDSVIVKNKQQKNISIGNRLIQQNPELFSSCIHFKVNNKKKQKIINIIQMETNPFIYQRARRDSHTSSRKSSQRFSLLEKIQFHKSIGSFSQQKNKNNT